MQMEPFQISKAGDERIGAAGHGKIARILLG